MADATPEEILAGLTPDQRAAVWRLYHGPKFLGPQPPAIPRVTAAALRRRELVEDDGAGSMIRLTELGRNVAAEHHRVRALVFPPEDGTVRMSAIMHARQHDRFTRWAFDGMVGQEIQLRKDLGGAYSGTLVAYEVIEDGAAVKLTIDVPVGVVPADATRLSLSPGTPE